MAKKHPILKGLGLLTGFVLVVFAAAFFYAYVTGGDPKALSLLAGDGIGILQVEGTIDDSRGILTELRRFRDAPWIKAIVLRIDSPGGAVAPTQEIFDELQRTLLTDLMIERQPIDRVHAVLLEIVHLVLEMVQPGRSRGPREKFLGLRLTEDYQ